MVGSFGTGNKLLLFLGVLAFGGMLFPAADWPMYVHDAAHTAVADSASITSANAGQLAQLWNLTNPTNDTGSPHYSPIVYNSSQGYAIIVGFENQTWTNGTVFILNSSSGAVLGSYDCDGGILGAGAVSNDILYIGCGNAGLHAINISDTASPVELWSYNFGNWIEVSPTVVDNIVYSASYAGSVVAINASTSSNTTLWTFGGGDLGSIASSPAVSGGILYIGAASLFALNASTGAHIWNYTPASSIESSPAASGGIVYFSADDGNAYALNASTGAHIWNYSIGPSGFGFYTTPLIASGIAYVGSNSSRAYALNASTGAHLWNYTASGNVMFPLASSNDAIVFSTDAGTLYVANASDSTILKQFDLTNALSAPAVAGGTIYVRKRAGGDLYAFAIAETPGCNCSTLSTANYICNLTASQSSPGATCFTVAAENVTINCAGFSITSDNTSDTYGIYSDNSSTTIENCVISSFSSAIYFNGSANGTIQNTTAAATSMAINIYSSSNNTIANSTATAAEYQAIRLVSNSNFNTITNTTATATISYAILLDTSSYNTIANTSATAADSAIYITSSSNNTIANTTFNSSGGTGMLLQIDSASANNTFYWNNFTDTSGLYVNDANGGNFYNATEGNIWADVVDGSVSIGGTTSSSGFPTLYIGTGGSGYPYSNNTSAKLSGNMADYAPLTPSLTTNCSGNISSNCSLSSNQSANGTNGINVTAENVTINCNGFSINGNSTSGTAGIFSIRSNTTIKNCRFTGFTYDILLSGLSGATINNVTFGTPIGLIINGTNDSAFSNLSFGNISQYGILVTNGSNRNNFTSVSINTTGSGSGIWVDGGGNNSFDCGGGLLYGTNTSSTYGIYSDQYNTTIRNCNISNFSTAIYFNGAVNGMIANTTASANRVTIELSSSNSTTIANSTVAAAADFAIYFHLSSNSNTIRNTTATATTQDAIYLQDSSNNTITNTTAITTAGNDAITLSGSSGTAISNSTANATQYAIYLLSNSDNCTISNTTAGAASYAIYLSSSSYSTISNTTATATSYGAITLLSSNNNTIANSTATATGGTGAIELQVSTNNTIINTTATAAGSNQYAIYIVSGSSHNTVTNTTASADSRAIYFQESSNNTIANSTATATTTAANPAIYLANSSDNTITNTTIEASGGAAILLYLDSASGGNTFYWDNFTATTSAYVNDTNGSNHYNATTQYATNEGNIWYDVMDSSVSIVGATSSSGFPALYIGTEGSGHPYSSNTSGKVTSNVADYAPLTPAIACTCGTLSTANYNCTLTSNQSSNATCFTVNAANVTINCAGFSITGNNSTYAAYGIYSTAFNTTIRNCQISLFDAGIAFNAATNGTMQNTTANTTMSGGAYSAGIALDNGSAYNTLGNSTAYSRIGDGIYLYSSSNFNTIAASSGISGTGEGIHIVSSSNNTITDSTGTSAAAGNGIFINNGANNSITDSSATSASGAAIDLFNSAAYNTIANSNATSTSSYGIYLSTSASYNNITNCRIRGHDNIVTGALVIRAGSQQNTVANSTINGNAGTYAATLQTGANTGNTFINNTFSNATNLVYLDASASANSFYWNNFTNVSGYYVNDAAGANYYNSSTEGNIWPDVMNGSVAVTGTTNSSGFPTLYIGAAGSGWPYSNNTSTQLSGNVADYAPLTPTRTTSSCVNLSDSSTYEGKITNVSNSTATFYINNDTLLCTDTYNIAVNATTTPALYFNCSNCRLDCNNSLLSAITNRGHGIRINGKNNVNITNCGFRDFKTTVYGNATSFGNFSSNTIYNASIYGFYLTPDSSNNYFSGNSINNVSGSAILVSGDNSTVVDNVISNCTNNGNGIYLTGTNETATGNTVNIASGGAGIYLYGANQSTIANNSIANASYGILLYDSSNNAISENNASGSSYGMAISQANDNNITYNNFSASGGATSYGASLGTSHGNWLYANYLGGTDLALYIEDTNTTQAFDNNVSTSGIGLASDAAGNYGCGNNGSSTLLDYGTDNAISYNACTPQMDLLGVKIEPASPTNEDTLTCKAIAYQELGAAFNFTFTWYLNGAANSSWNSNVTGTNVAWTYTGQNISAASLSAGQAWICQAGATDGSTTAYLNSTQKTVQNAAVQNVSDCRALNRSNTIYQLTANITAGVSPCFPITGDNITLDLQSYTVTGSSTGISLANRNGTTIANGTISTFDTGVSISSSNNTYIRGIAFSNCGTGGLVPAAIATIYTTDYSYGFYAMNNTFTSSVSAAGILLEDVYGGAIAENNFTGANIDGEAPAVTNVGVNITANRISNIGGTPDAIQVYGSNIIVSGNTIRNIYANAAYVLAGTGNSIFSNTITNASVGIWSGASGTSIYNNTIANASTGIQASDVDSNSIYENTITNGTRGISITRGDSHWIYNNTIQTGTGGYDIVISPDCTPLPGCGACVNNRLYNNSITSNGIYLANGTNGTEGCLNIGGAITSNGTSNTATNNSTCQISACQSIRWYPAAYTLLSNASTNGATCLNVTSAGLTIDCAGFTISGNNTTDTYGIYSNKFNTTIRNCGISSFGIGIFFDGASNGTMETVDSHGNNNYGIVLSSASNNTIANSTATATGSDAIYLTSSSGNAIANTTAAAADNTFSLLGDSNYNTITNVTATATNNYGIRFSSSSHNAVRNTTASAGVFAFHLDSSSYNTISNTSAAAGWYAIYLTSSNYSAISNTTATASNSYAISLVSGSSHNTVANATATASNNYGVYLDASSNNTIANTTATAASIAIQLNSSSNNTIANATFNSSSGTGALLQIDSASANNTFYWNNFTSTTGYYSEDFNGTNLYNATTPLGQNEGNIWADVMNGSVAATGTSSSSGFPTLYIGTNGTGYPYSNNTSSKLSGSIADYAPLTPTLTSDCNCSTISTANYNCTLAGNQSISGDTCFTVNAENVTIDCAGFAITGNVASGTYGIHSNSSGTTIRDCSIRNFATAIYFNGVAGGTIANSTTSTTYDTSDGISNGMGIVLRNNANHNTIANTSAAAKYYAIYLSSSPNNTITNATAAATDTYGLRLESSPYNTITNTTATATNSHAIRLESSSGNTIRNTAATATNFAFFLATSSDNNSISNMTAAATGAPNSFAIDIDSSDNNTIANSSATAGNSYALYIFSSSNNTISNTTIVSSSGTGILASLSSSCSGNTFYWNNFTATSGSYVEDSNGSNYYNSTEGNIWFDVMNGSVNITGATSSSGFPTLYIGTAGAGYPYSNNTSGKVTSGVVDRAPLTSSNATSNITPAAYFDDVPSYPDDYTNISGRLMVFTAATNTLTGYANSTAFANWTILLYQNSTLVNSSLCFNNSAVNGTLCAWNTSQTCATQCENYILILNATDASGGHNDSSQIFNLTIDNVAPNVSVPISNATGNNWTARVNITDNYLSEANSFVLDANNSTVIYWGHLCNESQGDTCNASGSGTFNQTWSFDAYSLNGTAVPIYYKLALGNGSIGEIPGCLSINGSEANYTCRGTLSDGKPYRYYLVYNLSSGDGIFMGIASEQWCTEGVGCSLNNTLIQNGTTIFRAQSDQYNSSDGTWQHTNTSNITVYSVGDSNNPNLTYAVPAAGNYTFTFYGEDYAGWSSVSGITEQISPSSLEAFLDADAFSWHNVSGTNMGFGVGLVDLIGYANDSDFANWTILLYQNNTLLNASLCFNNSAANGTFCTWNTSATCATQCENYTLLLNATDTAGNYNEQSVPSITIDNLAPQINSTANLTLSYSSSGGAISTKSMFARVNITEPYFYDDAAYIFNASNATIHGWGRFCNEQQADACASIESGPFNRTWNTDSYTLNQTVVPAYYKFSFTSYNNTATVPGCLSQDATENNYTSAGSCSNGIDDDSDSAADCADPDCATDPACGGTPNYTCGGACTNTSVCSTWRWWLVYNFSAGGQEASLVGLTNEQLCGASCAINTSAIQSGTSKFKVQSDQYNGSGTWQSLNTTQITLYSAGNNSNQNLTFAYANGDYRIAFKAEDYAGWSSIAVWDLPYIDNAAPVIALDSPAGNTNSSNASQSFNFTATDNSSATFACSLLIDGALNQTNASVANSTSTAFSASNLSQGTHTWAINCTDGVLNTNTSASRNFTIDTAGPATALNLPVAGYNTSSTTVAFNWTATDALRTSLNCNLTINGTLNQTNISATSGISSQVSVANFTDGVYLWNVTCADDLGNTATSAETRNFTINTAAPVTVLNLPVAGYNSSSATVAFNWTATDALRTSLNCNLTINGTLNQTNISATSGISSQVSVANFTDGTYLWNVTCANDLGNTATSAETRNFTVDTAAPATVLNLPVAAYNTSSTTVTFNWTATDALRTSLNCNLTINGTANQTNISATSGISSQVSVANFTDGTYLWNVTCADDLGNTATSAETRNFTIDTAAPATVLNLPVAGYNASSTTVTFNWTATDALRTSLNCNLTINGTLNQTNISATSGISSQVSVANFTDGTYLWNVTCADDLGNTAASNETRNFTVDTAAPTLSISSPNASTIYNSTTVLVNFTATDTNLSSCWFSANGGANNSTACTSGAASLLNHTFSEGMQTLRISANDSAGNTAYAFVAFVMNTSGSSAIANESNYTVPANITEVVIANTSAVQQISIPSNTSGSTSIYLAMPILANSTNTSQTIIALDSPLNISRNTSGVGYNVSMPSNMTITGPANWTGELLLPTVNSSSFTIPATSGYTTSQYDAMVIGFANGNLTFDRAIRILFAGQGTKLVGYVVSGSTTVVPVASTCSADSQTAGDALSAGAECKITVGSDLIVWTKHFTTYVLYTETATPTPNPPSGGSNNGGGSTGGPAATSHNEQNYSVDIGSGRFCTIQISRIISSSTSLSVLTTTLDSMDCTLENFTFNDTMPSNFTTLNITFSPMYTTRDGWMASFNFPSFTPGESRVLTYSVNGWVPTSRLDGFSNCTMTANKQEIAPQPSTNITQNQTHPSANVTQNATAGTSQSAIDAAALAIANAKAAGKDTTAAEKELANAGSAFGLGDYEKALQLANNAKYLAGTAPIAPQQPAPQPQAGENDILIMAAVLVAVLAVGAAITSGMFGRTRFLPGKKGPIRPKVE